MSKVLSNVGFAGLMRASKSKAVMTPCTIMLDGPIQMIPHWVEVDPVPLFDFGALLKDPQSVSRIERLLSRDPDEHSSVIPFPKCAFRWLSGNGEVVTLIDGQRATYYVNQPETGWIRYPAAIEVWGKFSTLDEHIVCHIGSLNRFLNRLKGHQEMLSLAISLVNRPRFRDQSSEEIPTLVYDLRTGKPKKAPKNKNSELSPMARLIRISERDIDDEEHELEFRIKRLRDDPGTRSPHLRRAHIRKLKSGSEVAVRSSAIHGGNQALPTYRAVA